VQFFIEYNQLTGKRLEIAAHSTQIPQPPRIWLLCRPAADYIDTNMRQLSADSAGHNTLFAHTHMLLLLLLLPPLLQSHSSVRCSPRAVRASSAGCQ
jgi:hypothetical protein